MLRLALIFPLLALAACGPTPAKRAAPVIASLPAQNCVSHGGDLVIRQSSTGQKVFCMLHDGRTLDANEYYRQTNP